MIENTSTEQLHHEHNIWKDEIKFKLAEIKFLKKILNEIKSKNSDKDISNKADKYLNHIEHNVRFLKTILDTICAHESFLKHNYEFQHQEEVIEEKELADFDDLDEPEVIMSDHDKTRQHLEDFKNRYERLKLKIYKLREKAMKSIK